MVRRWARPGRPPGQGERASSRPDCCGAQLAPAWKVPTRHHDSRTRFEPSSGVDRVGPTYRPIDKGHGARAAKQEGRCWSWRGAVILP